MSVIDLYLIRHGETEANIQKKVCGQNDTKLTNHGIEQLVKLKHQIGHLSPNKCYTSALSRAIESHKIVFSNYAYESYPDLNETNTGTLSDLTFDELHQKYPEFLYQGKNNHLKYENGESISDVYSRICKWVDNTILCIDNDSVVTVCGHAGTVNCILHYLLSTPIFFYPAYHVENAKFAHISIDTHNNINKLVSLNK